MIRTVVCCSLLFGSATFAAAADLGKIGNDALLDVDGKPRARDEWRDSKAVVYCFLGTECPVSNGYAAQMQRLAEQYAAQGATFVGAYSEPGVAADEAKQHGVEYGLKFVRLLDGEQKLAAQAGIQRVPTFVVVRPDGTIAYRGRIDDRWSPEGKRRNDPRTHELADAVEAVLAGKSPPLAETPTFGCPLPKRSQKSEIGNQK